MELVKDGVDREHLAVFLMQSAIEILDQDKTPASSGTANKFVLEYLLDFIGTINNYGTPLTQGVPKSAPSFHSETQEHCHSEMRETIKRLIEDDKCPRKEVYRSLLINLLASLKSSGINEDLRIGVRKLLIDLGRSMDDPAMDDYLAKHGRACLKVVG